MRSTSKYLERHAEPVARREGLSTLATLSTGAPWDHVLVIPARRESSACLAAADAACEGAAVLCILVVNAASEAEDQRSGEQLLAALAAWPTPWRDDGLSLHRGATLDVLAVDRCRGPRCFGDDEGVGLARKLGADLALALHARGSVRSPWIHTTDADARLPAEHFERVVALTDTAAAVAPYWHAPGDDARVNAATALYELSLRYHVAGLRFAASPYAFATIGSTISVSCEAYASVRGFPRRLGGEDFYLLNKVAKLGPVRSLGGAPVELRSRRSTRAPFGTGPAVEALLEDPCLRVYDPRVFEVLRALVRGLDHAHEAGFEALEQLAADYPDIAPLRACVDHTKVLARRYGPSQLTRRAHESFDAFRTLKLIHALTALRWPKLEWSEAAGRAPFLALDEGLSIDEQRRVLAARG